MRNLRIMSPFPQVIFRSNIDAPSRLVSACGEQTPFRARNLRAGNQARTRTGLSPAGRTALASPDPHGRSALLRLPVLKSARARDAGGRLLHVPAAAERNP